MSKFKDVNGRWLTKGIFKETSTNPEFVIYTLEEAKNLYLECEDITGYLFATTALGGWKHWLALQKSYILAPHLKEWEEELEVKLRSKALMNIVTIAESEKGYQAAKFLIDKGWEVRKGAGRPSKEEIEKEKKVQSKMYSEFDKVVGMKKKK